MRIVATALSIMLISFTITIVHNSQPWDTTTCHHQCHCQLSMDRCFIVIVIIVWQLTTTTVC